MKNYYDLLNVNSNSSHDEIRKSYRKMSLLYHPDRNKSLDAENIFKQVNEAYEILGNEEKRIEYDNKYIKQNQRSYSNLPKQNYYEQKNQYPHQNYRYNEETNQEHEMKQTYQQPSYQGMKTHNVDDIANLYNYMFNGLSTKEQTNSQIPIHLDYQSYQMCDDIMKSFMNGVFKKLPPHSANYQNYFKNSFEQLSNMKRPIEVIKVKHDLTLEQIYSGCSFQIQYLRKIISYNMDETNEYVYKTVTVEKGIDTTKPVILKYEGHNCYDTLGNVEITINELPHNTFKRNGLDLVLEKTITLKEALTGFNITFCHLNNKQYTLQNKDQIITPNSTREIPNLGFMNQTNKGMLIVAFTITFPESLTEEQIEKLKLLL